MQPPVMCARPPFELISVSPAREAKSAPAAVPMVGSDGEARGNPIISRYAPYRAQSVRKDEVSAEMLGLRSVQSGPAGLTHSTETSGASLATAAGPEAKLDRASSMAPGCESLAQTNSRETTAQVPSLRDSSEGCSSSQARYAPTSGCGSNSNNNRREASGCGSTRGGVCAGGSPDAAAPEAAGNCARGDSCCRGVSSETKSCRGAGASSHGCAPVSEQGSTGSGSGQTEDQLNQQAQQGLRAHTAGLSRETAAAAAATGAGPQRIRPSIARVTVRRVVKRKAMEERTVPSGTQPGSGIDAVGVAAAGGGGVPSTKPTFGDLEDLWRQDSEAKSYCSFVCSAPAMCRSGQEGVAGPTPEIPGMIVADSSRRKRMRTAAQESNMALLV